MVRLKSSFLARLPQLSLRPSPENRTIRKHKKGPFFFWQNYSKRFVILSLRTPSSNFSNLFCGCDISQNQKYLLDLVAWPPTPKTPFISEFISTDRSPMSLSWYILLPISATCSSTSSSIWSTFSCSSPFLMTVTPKPFALASRKASYQR